MTRRVLDTSRIARTVAMLTLSFLAAVVLFAGDPPWSPGRTGATPVTSNFTPGFSAYQYARVDH
jgi:hypothetical protein